MKKQYDKYTSYNNTYSKTNNTSYGTSSSSKRKFYDDSPTHYTCQSEQIKLNGSCQNLNCTSQSTNRQFCCTCETIAPVDCNPAPLSCNEICNYYKLYNYKVGQETMYITTGESPEFATYEDDCEINVDSVLQMKKIIVIWGEVKDKCNENVDNVLVTLLKETCFRGNYDYIRVASTTTDELGYYQFYLPYEEGDLNYRVTLGKKIVF